MRSQPEHAEAVALMQMVRLHEARHPELQFLAHIPNGGARSKAAAGKLKAEGVRPGVLDYLWPLRRGQYVGLALELKAGKNKVTDNQQRWIAHLEAQGWLCVVAYSWSEAWHYVSEYGGIK